MTAWQKLVVLSIGLSLPIFAQQDANRLRHPDVFLITIDTLRADHVGCYGYAGVKTPAIDDLARDGVRFAQAYTPSPITNSSHTSILTGLLPSTHGVTDFAVPLSSAHATWAEILHREGYHTAAFIGSVILDSKTLAPGFGRGFDFYDNFPVHARTKSRWGRVERRGMTVVQHAEIWLDAHPAGPHFVWVHLYDPHDPYEPPAPYLQVYRDHLYDGEIAYADSALANFVSYLKRKGWYANSIVIVVGDHGEGLGEHHELTHGIFLYDSTTHVPLIFKLAESAGAGAGKVLEAQVRTIDILPTVLELTDSPAQKIDGESLTPYFSGASAAARIAYGETDYPLRFGWAPLRSVRADGYKFIEAPRPEFYDLRTDSGELENHYEPWNPEVQKFRALLVELRSKAAPVAPSAGSVDQSTINELKALGYLGRADIGSATNVPKPSLLPDPKDRIEEANLLHTAMLASDDGRISDARAALEKVLQINPKSPNGLRDLGELELASGDYSAAAGHLKAAVVVRPNDATALYEEGEALQHLNDLTGARNAFEAGLKLQPGQLDARLRLGNVYFGLKDYGAAEDQFEASGLLAPKSLEAKLGLARAQIAEGKFTDAATALQKLSESERKNAHVFELLAEAYSGLGKTDEARQAAARAKLLRQPHAGDSK